MRLTAIDIGTNTVLMLIADVSKDGTILPVQDEISFPRLGRGVDETGLVNQESIERVLEVLRDYKKRSDTMHSERIVACGTSALRDSRNSRDVLQKIKAATELDVEVLSGEEEADWTFFGATSNFKLPSEEFAVIDIGGGSTEITLGTERERKKRVSLNVGCVRLTERFLSKAPPSTEALEQAKAFARRMLSGLGRFGLKGYELVGVAGTVTTLGALDLGLQKFDAKKIHGHVLPLERIHGMFESLRHQTHSQISFFSLVPEGRADVLLAGILILIEFMEEYRLQRIWVSTQGLRYGILLREMERMKSSPPGE